MQQATRKPINIGYANSSQDKTKYSICLHANIFERIIKADNKLIFLYFRIYYLVLNQTENSTTQFTPIPYNHRIIKFQVSNTIWHAKQGLK